MRTGIMSTTMNHSMNAARYQETKNTYKVINNRRAVDMRKRCNRTIRRDAVIKCMILAFVMMLMICISSFVIVDASERNSTKTMNKYYTSITIQADDTLWDIAQQYNSGNESTVQYINSIKKLNNMSSDTLYNGNNLLVYYFDYE